jgi:hypothetical protein
MQQLIFQSKQIIAIRWGNSMNDQLKKVKFF